MKKWLVLSLVLMTGILLTSRLWLGGYHEKSGGGDGPAATSPPQSLTSNAPASNLAGKSSDVPTDCLNTLHAQLPPAEWLKQFLQCAEVSPETAARWAVQHAPAILVARALEGALRFWAIKAPAGAFSFADREVGNGALRLKLLQQVVQTWIRSDENACVIGITNLASAIDRALIATALLSDLSGVNPSAVWQIVQSLDSRSGARLQLLAGLAEHWVREDRQAAFTWLQSLAEADFAAAASKVLPALASVDPVQASAVADSLGESLSFELRCDILREWAATDIDAALKWAEKIKDPQKQTLAKRNAIAVVAKTDPVKAYDLTKTLPPASQVEAAIDIAAQWSKRDVRSAADWVQAFPSGPFKEKAMILLAREWAANDTEAAAVWLRKLPAGTQRDKIVSEYAESITQFRPDLASYWSLNIQDESESQRRLLEAFSKWYFVSPTEASAWLGKTELPAPLKERLLKLSGR